MYKRQEQQREARKKALRLLEHMDRTEKGLTDRLLRAGFSEELAEDAVSYVKDYGYINDRRYALNYIMYRIHDKSRQKIFQELSGKGIDRQTIQDAWEEAEELETCLLYTSGINLGTLGFLAEIDKTSIYTALDKLFADDYEIEERMMLTGTVWRGDVYKRQYILE